MTYSTVGIILRRRDAGEWDRIYTVYTRERGKLTLLGKGTRRSKAKLASHLEPYAEVDLVVANGKTIDRITFARTIEASSAIAASWERAQLAAFVCESVDALVGERHRDPAVYDLLRTALRTLVSGHPASCILHSAFAAPFTIRLLSLLGYAPQLNHCIECRASLPDGPATGIPLRGGLACQTCAVSVRDGIPLAARDRQQLADAVASFRPFEASPAVTDFARVALEAHLWQPLQTDIPSRHLTGAVASRTMAPS
jgi:DNA repair protein RecO (recombination protein O)